MSANLGGVGDLLLHYNAHYKLLICLECKYAIQKTAVGSHLLRHKIYRGERQKLLSAISELELLEPDDVDVPPARCEPVEGLAVIAGYKCSATNCGSLYASVKRMRRHWSESHGLSNLPENYACAVNLQTFFRGTKLRYFEVLDRAASTAEEGLLLAGDGSSKQQQQQQQQQQDLNPMSCAQAVLFSRSSEFDLDMEKLRYFHHFTTMTSLTLPAGKPNPVKYWQTDVVAQAVHLRWLMFGLLSISASHLAVLSEDGMLKRSHLELSAQFRQEFLAGWTSADAFDDDVMKMGARMVCIQRFCVWTSEWPAQEPVPLQSFVTTIRGCTNPNIMLDSIMNSDDVTMNMNGQSTTHLPNPNASLRTDMSKSALLEHFSNLPYRMAEKLGRPNDLTDFMAVMSAIGTLIESCRQSFAADDVESVWMGVKEWPAKVSERFTQMAIIEKTPAALVVLAQWLMLVARAERFCWFLRGLAMKMLHQIVKELGEDNSLQSLVEELVGRGL